MHKRIGVIGGGQLGRMMIEESLRLNLQFQVLDPDPTCSCAHLANTFIQGKLTDADKIRELAAISDVLTYEIEHVNTEVLLALEAEGKEIYPSPSVLRIIQDKGLQKHFYHKHGIPTAPFILVESPENWADAIPRLGTPKFVAKTRKDGYDGKGVCILDSEAVLQGKTPIPFDSACVLEAFIPCQKEISVMVARDRDGNMRCWPSVEMEFDPQANLVTFLSCPADLREEEEQQAEQIAMHLVEALGGVGVFAVELFLTHDGSILVNETAPRAHNSGHHTIEACYTSQFEQWARVLAGLPLGSSDLILPAVMMNLLGGDFQGAYRLDGIEKAMQVEGVYIHLYDKKENKPMRKMGHVTVLGESPIEAITKAKAVHSWLHFVPAE